MLPTRRDAFWENLRNRILDSLQEFQASQEKADELLTVPAHKVSENADNNLSRSMFESDDRVQILVHLLEEQLVEHKVLVERVVAKQEELCQSVQSLSGSLSESPWVGNEAQMQSSDQSAIATRSSRTSFGGSSTLVVYNDENEVVDELELDMTENSEEQETSSPQASRQNKRYHSEYTDSRTISDHKMRRSILASMKQDQIDEAERSPDVKNLARQLSKHASSVSLTSQRSNADVASGCVRSFAESPGFHFVCSVAIILNAAWIGFQCEVNINEARKTPPANEPDWFDTPNRIFLAFFLSELIVRIIAYRLAFLWGPTWQWNILDFVLVMTALTEELMDSLNLSFFRTLKVMRLMRTLRMIRVLRFFRELRQMLAAIMQTLASLMWAMIVILCIMYLFAIVFMQALLNYLQEPDDPETRKNLLEWFSTVHSSILALFRAISGGQDWYELQKPLGEISFVYSVLMASYVFFVVFGVLNALVSIFVERAAEALKLDLDNMTHGELKATETFAHEMRDIFDDIDKDNTGSIDEHQFDTYWQKPRVKALFKTRHLESAAYHLFSLQTEEGKMVKQLDKNEFIARMMTLRGPASAAALQMSLQDSRHQYEKLMSVLQDLEDKMNIIGQSVSTSSDRSPRGGRKSFRRVSVNSNEKDSPRRQYSPIHTTNETDAPRFVKSIKHLLSV